MLIRWTLLTVNNTLQLEAIGRPPNRQPRDDGSRTPATTRHRAQSRDRKPVTIRDCLGRRVTNQVGHCPKGRVGSAGRLGTLFLAA
jgi:hypothetical protein